MRASYLLDKLYEMDKKLGGREHINEKKKNYDEFTGLKEVILNLFFEIRKKMDQMQAVSGRTNETIKLEFEVKEKMATCNQKITKMNEYLKKNRSKDENLFEKRQKIFDSLHKQYITLNQLLFNTNDVDSSSDILSVSADPLDSSRNAKLIEKRPRGVNRELTDIEKNGMKEIEENNIKQDDLIKILNEGVISLKVKAEKMGESIDHTISQCKLLDQEMSKTEQVLVASNDKLKTLLKAYRSPQKCCLDFVLILIIVGLIVTIYYQMK